MSRADHPDPPLRPDGPAEERFAGRTFRVTSVPVLLASGRKSRRDVVRHPGAVGVLPIDLTGAPDVVLLRQYRFAIDAHIWEIPAGTLDRPGEPLAACARRELLEETGLEAETLREVGAFYTAPGFCDERLTLYAAWGLRTAAERPPADDDERIEVQRMPFPAALQLRDVGRIDDAKTIIALDWLERVLADGAHVARPR